MADTAHQPSAAQSGRDHASRRARLVPGAEESDQEAMGRMHWLVQCVLMAAIVVALTAVSIVIVDGQLNTGYVADAIASLRRSAP
jgi:hypothetical protein